jgi:tetratricopeptide (TPR) repeat protein
LNLLDNVFKENNKFEETLFAYLWDKIGEGTVEEYICFLNSLLKKNYIKDTESYTGKPRVFLITQKGYEYLKKCLKDRLEMNYKIIYYLIFRYYLKQIKIKIDEARNSNSLKRYEGNISELNRILNEDIEYLKKIQSIFKLKDNNELIKVLEVEIKHIKAIIYSRMGDLECIKIYGDIVMQAKKKTKMSTTELLSLGYLAHELMFVDIKKALEFGKKAYTLVEKSNNNSLKMKNTCNYIKILLYAGKEKELNEVLVFFEYELKNIKTERTNGRIQLQLALIAITENDYDKAEKCLEHYSNEKDDPRRYAVSLAYKGICYYVKDRDKGKKQLLEAIQGHHRENDNRHLIFGILIYIWMEDNKFNGDINEKDIDKYTDIKQYSACLKNNKYKHFIKFWKEHFHSNILLKMELK